MYGISNDAEGTGRLMEIELNHDSPMTEMFRAQRLRIFCDPPNERFAVELLCPTHDGTLQWTVLPIGALLPNVMLPLYQSLFGTLVHAVAANSLVISVVPAGD